MQNSGRQKLESAGPTATKTRNNASVRHVAIIGCGWLGTPLAIHLLKQGYQVTATQPRGSRAHPALPDAVRQVELDLVPEPVCNDPGALYAAEIAVCLLPPRIRQTDRGTYPERIRNLADFLLSGNLDKIILVSSTSVYPGTGGKVDETAKRPPDSRSGLALLEAERFLLEHERMQCTVLRLAGLCGPGREPGRLLAGRKQVAGGLSPVNLIHQEDAIRILSTLVRKQPYRQIFNGCAPSHPIKKDFYPAASRALALPEPTFRLDPVAWKWVQAQKICDQLNFSYRNPDPATWKF